MTHDTPPETPVAIKTSGSYSQAQALGEVARSVRDLGTTFKDEAAGLRGSFKRETNRHIWAVTLAALVCLAAIGGLFLYVRALTAEVQAARAEQRSTDTKVEAVGRTTENTKAAVDDAAVLVAAKPQVDIEIVPPPASASASAKPKAQVVIRPRPAPSAPASASAGPAVSVVIPLEVPSGPQPKEKR